jgi:hypothetical protein
MSSYLAGIKAFSMNADISFEVVTKQGEKLALCSSATIVVQRPAQLWMHRKGRVADAEVIFDGKTLTLYGKKRNVYYQTDVAAGTIDDAIRAYEQQTGIPAPGADLLFSDPYAILSSGIESSAYYGMAYVGGIECHHLAFREDKVDWQLWVQTGDRPLPMKYVITTPWQTGSPSYELALRDWNTNPQIPDGQFTFSPPDGATKLDTIPTSEADEFSPAEEE